DDSFATYVSACQIHAPRRRRPHQRHIMARDAAPRMTGGQQNEERSGETLVVAEALSLGYRGRPVLRDVTLRIGAGEVWFLLGPNGSGKSTFVAGVLGALTPLAGTLTLHPRLRDRSAIGVVPQRSEPNRLLPTTVRELVTLGAVGQRLDGPTRAARLEWALRH